LRRDRSVRLRSSVPPCESRSLRLLRFLRELIE
jgi:hypothetical protein